MSQRERLPVARRAQPRRQRSSSWRPSASSATSAWRSGWQADNAGDTAMPGRPGPPAPTIGSQVPMARVNGQLVTGNVLARIVNRSGVGLAAAQRDGQPGALPAGDARTPRDATLTTHTKETDERRRHRRQRHPVERLGLRALHAPPTPSRARRSTTTRPTCPGNLPVQICLRNGFNPALLYQLVYPAKNAYVLGVGVAAFRDVGRFFKYADRRRLRHAPTRSPGACASIVDARRLAVRQLHCASSSTWA